MVWSCDYTAYHCPVRLGLGQNQRETEKQGIFFNVEKRKSDEASKKIPKAVTRCPEEPQVSIKAVLVAGPTKTRIRMSPKKNLINPKI